MYIYLCNLCRAWTFTSWYYYWRCGGDNIAKQRLPRRERAVAEKIAAANDAQKLYKVVCCGNVKWRCAVGGGRCVVVVERPMCTSSRAEWNRNWLGPFYVRAKQKRTKKLNDFQAMPRFPLRSQILLIFVWPRIWIAIIYAARWRSLVKDFGQRLNCANCAPNYGRHCGRYS